MIDLVFASCFMNSALTVDTIMSTHYCKFDRPSSPGFYVQKSISRALCFISSSYLEKQLNFMSAECRCALIITTSVIVGIFPSGFTPRTNESGHLTARPLLKSSLLCSLVWFLLFTTGNEQVPAALFPEELILIFNRSWPLGVIHVCLPLQHFHIAMCKDVGVSRPV